MAAAGVSAQQQARTIQRGEVYTVRHVQMHAKTHEGTCAHDTLLLLLLLAVSLRGLRPLLLAPLLLTPLHAAAATDAPHEPYYSNSQPSVTGKFEIVTRYTAYR